MHPVVKREVLSPNVTRLEIEAERIAQVRRPGQFVIVRIGDGAERVPLTIADANPEAGTITLTIQAVGKTSCDLCMLQEGDAIQDVAGPLGEATELIDSGHAVCVGGGVICLRWLVRLGRGLRIFLLVQRVFHRTPSLGQNVHSHPPQSHPAGKASSIPDARPWRKR